MNKQKSIIGNIIMMIATSNYSEYINGELRQIIKDLQCNTITTDEATSMITYVTRNSATFQK